MNPTEHAELMMQVDELLEKGFIKKSISPCAVPALLTSKKDETLRMCVRDQQDNSKVPFSYSPTE